MSTVTYVIIFNITLCVSLLAAFIEQSAKFGAAALIILFSIDAIFSFYPTTDYIRLALDLLTIGLLIAYFTKNQWHKISDHSKVYTGLCLMVLGAITFTLDNSPWFMATGFTILVIGSWPWLYKTIQKMPKPKLATLYIVMLALELLFGFLSFVYIPIIGLFIVLLGNITLLYGAYLLVRTPK